MAITLKPFRQYDEHDVINMFAYDVDATVTAGVQATAGTIVQTTSGGWKAGEDIHDITASQPNAAVNNHSYGNTLSLRYNLLAEVVKFAGLTDDGVDVVQPLGMLLHDVRTLDENGEAVTKEVGCVNVFGERLVNPRLHLSKRDAGSFGPEVAHEVIQSAEAKQDQPRLGSSWGGIFEGSGDPRFKFGRAEELGGAGRFFVFYVHGSS